MGHFKLSRRTMLRAGGVAVGLPLLEAMMGGSRAMAQGGAPVRIINFFWPNGVNSADFFRANSVSRQPLAAVAGDINFITGLRNNIISDFNRGAALRPLGSHGCGGAGFASSVNVTSAGAGGPSYDQVAAAALGGATKFRSLVVSGQTRVYLPPHFHNLSWTGRNNAAQPIRDPLRVYDQLFSATTSEPATPGAPSTALRDRRSVLDFVRKDAKRLQAKLGSADRMRLEEHLTALRELEQQLGGGEGGNPSGGCTTPPRPEAPGGTDIAARGRLYSELIAKALSCDLTRYVTFQLADAMYEGAIIPDAAGRNDHDLSHGTDANSVNLIIKSTAAKMAALAHLITTLKSVPEGNGTLLDNTHIFASSEIADSAGHGWTNMPVILAGRGGGKIATGRTLNYPNRSVADVFATVLTVAGVPTAQFGDGTGPLPSLAS